MSFRKWWTDEKVALLLALRSARAPWPVIADELSTSEEAAKRAYYRLLQAQRRKQRAARIVAENRARIVMERYGWVPEAPAVRQWVDPSDELLRRLREVS